MELIAEGRTADVFALDDSTVLRRYRNGDDTELEARVMRHLEEHGYPVPHVVDAGGTDIVMERIEGATLVDMVAREPDKVERYGRLLGELHERLHRMPAPEWLPGSGAGRVIIHRDLHPQNVMLSVRGPVVIDWNIVTAGRAAEDAAITVLLTLGADFDVPASIAERIDSLRPFFVDAFLHTCGTDPREGLAAAIAYRSATPNNTGRESGWLQRDAPDCLDPFYLESRVF